MLEVGVNRVRIRRLAQSLQGRRRNMSSSGKPNDVAEPPTNSTPIGFPEVSPFVVRLPAMNVWMSPLSTTRFFDPLVMELGEDLLALRRVAIPLVLIRVLAGGGSSAIIIVSLASSFHRAFDLAASSSASVFCGRAEEGAARMQVVRAGLDLNVVARLLVAVLALVGQE